MSLWMEGKHSVLMEFFGTFWMCKCSQGNDEGLEWLWRTIIEQAEMSGFSAFLSLYGPSPML